MKALKSLFALIKKWYNGAIRFLVSMKCVAYFLAHGGFHMVIMALCFILSYCIYQKIQTYNHQDFRQFSFRIEGDTLNNYKLSHISIHHTKANPSKNDVVNYVEGFICHFKYGIRKDSLKELNTLVCNVKPYEGLIVDAIQKITLTFDDSVYFDNVSEDKEGIKTPDAITPHNTGKFGGDYHENKCKSYHYCAFTKEDTIKEDQIGFHGPNITNNWEGDNPYFACFYGFHALPGTYDLDDNSVIMITYNKYPYKEQGLYWSGSKDDMFLEAPMSIESIYPQPTELTLQNIVYRGKDVEKVFEQGGIYVTAVDPLRKAEADKRVFGLTVLIGILLAFALDIFVQLVIKWRKL